MERFPTNGSKQPDKLAYHMVRGSGESNATVNDAPLGGIDLNLPPPPNNVVFTYRSPFPLERERTTRRVVPVRVVQAGGHGGPIRPTARRPVLLPDLNSPAVDDDGRETTTPHLEGSDPCKTVFPGATSTADTQLRKRKSNEVDEGLSGVEKSRTLEHPPQTRGLDNSARASTHQGTLFRPLAVRERTPVTTTSLEAARSTGHDLGRPGGRLQDRPNNKGKAKLLPKPASSVVHHVNPRNIPGTTTHVSSTATRPLIDINTLPQEQITNEADVAMPQNYPYEQQPSYTGRTSSNTNNDAAAGTSGMVRSPQHQNPMISNTHMNRVNGILMTVSTDASPMRTNVRSSSVSPSKSHGALTQYQERLPLSGDVSRTVPITSWDHIGRFNAVAREQSVMWFLIGNGDLYSQGSNQQQQEGTFLNFSSGAVNGGKNTKFQRPQSSNRSESSRSTKGSGRRNKGRRAPGPLVIRETQSNANYNSNIDGTGSTRLRMPPAAGDSSDKITTILRGKGKQIAADNTTSSSVASDPRPPLTPVSTVLDSTSRTSSVLGTQNYLMPPPQPPRTNEFGHNNNVGRFMSAPFRDPREEQREETERPPPLRNISKEPKNKNVNGAGGSNKNFNGK